MKFKVLPGGAIYNNLRLFSKKVDSVRVEARKLCKELGGETFAADGRFLAGGISGIVFNAKPDGWRVVGDSYRKLFFPKINKQNKAILAKIDLLPKINSKELNSIVSFEGPQTIERNDGGHGMYWVECPKVFFGEKYILIDVSEGCTYKPPVGVIEILESEFIKLKTRIENERRAVKVKA